MTAGQPDLPSSACKVSTSISPRAPNCDARPGVQLSGGSLSKSSVQLDKRALLMLLHQTSAASLHPGQHVDIGRRTLSHMNTWPQSLPDITYSSSAPQNATPFTVCAFLWPAMHRPHSIRRGPALVEHSSMGIWRSAEQQKKLTQSLNPKDCTSEHLCSAASLHPAAARPAARLLPPTPLLPHLSCTNTQHSCIGVSL